MLWKKWEPWLSSIPLEGGDASTMTLAPAICGQATGMPSQGSEAAPAPEADEHVRGPRGDQPVVVFARPRSAIARVRDGSKASGLT